MLCFRSIIPILKCSGTDVRWCGGLYKRKRGATWVNAYNNSELETEESKIQLQGTYIGQINRHGSSRNMK